MFESYARYEIRKLPINIIKSISNKRTNYFTYDEHPPQIVFAYSNTKIQTNRIERKIEKGEADASELQTHLIVVN